MESHQFNLLLTALDRIAEALEARGEPKRTRAKAPEVFDVKSMRATVEAALGGTLASIDELRDVMNMRQASAQAVSKAAQACGFTRHRSSTGVRFAIVVDASAVRPGRKLRMPDNLEAGFAAYQAAGRKRSALQFLGMCNRDIQYSQAHIDEVKRLYPGAFED